MDHERVGQETGLPAGPALPWGLPAPLLTVVGGTLLAGATWMFASVSGIEAGAPLAPIVFTGTTAALGAGYLLWVRSNVTRERHVRWVAGSLMVTAVLMVIEQRLGQAAVPELSSLAGAGPYVASHLVLPAGVVLACSRWQPSNRWLFVGLVGVVAAAWYVPAIADDVLGLGDGRPGGWTLLAVWMVATTAWLLSTGTRPRWTEAWVSVALVIGTVQVLVTLLAAGDEVLSWTAAALRWQMFVLPAAGLIAGVVRVHRALERRTLELQEETEAHRRDNAELAHRNAELDAYAAVLAHDLRAPLAIASWNLESLSDGLVGQLDDEALRVVGAAQVGQRRALSMITELLTLARSRDQELELEVIEVDQLVEDVVRTVPDIEHDQVTVTTDGPVVADRTALRQTLQNLLGNAAAYGAHVGRLRLAVDVTRTAGRGWRVTVGDNGPGIEEGDRERVFAAFERLDQRAPRTGGTGLGLAICRRLVERHGGEIGVGRSETLGGAEFWLTLPARVPTVLDLREGAVTDTRDAAEHESG